MILLILDKIELIFDSLLLRLDEIELRLFKITEIFGFSELIKLSNLIAVCSNVKMAFLKYKIECIKTPFYIYPDIYIYILIIVILIYYIYMI